MEDQIHPLRSFVGSVPPSDYVLQMEPESTCSTPPQQVIDSDSPRRNSADVDICYPYSENNSDPHPTLDTNALKSLLKRPTDIEEERKLTAKLDDLLDSKTSEKGFMSRRYSLYGENVKVKRHIEITLISIMLTFSFFFLGSFKHRSRSESIYLLF
jgi:hypothetical protein